MLDIIHCMIVGHNISLQKDQNVITSSGAGSVMAAAIPIWNLAWWRQENH